MAFIHSPRIVTDGMVLYLDAANPRSYPRSGTSWFDIIGNNNVGTLTNGPTFNSSNNGFISFNGSTNYVDVANQANFNFADTTFTISVWLRTSSASGFVLTKGYIVGGWVVSIDTGLIGTAVKNSNGFTSFTRSSTMTVNDGIWHNIVVIFTTSTTVAANNDSQIYIDGNLRQGTKNTTANVYSVETTNLQIGRRINDFYYTGNIASIQIYNRRLSAQEILQNYNATRSRFGV